MPEVDKPAGLHHLAIKSSSPRALADFYVRVLGLEEAPQHSDAHGLPSVWLALGAGQLLMRAHRDRARPAEADSQWALLAVAVALAKYAYRMPLTRQEKEMRRQGLVVSSQALWDQIFALARHLEPSFEALRAYVLSSLVIGVDETTWRLMEKKLSKKWWV